MSGTIARWAQLIRANLQRVGINGTRLNRSQRRQLTKDVIRRLRAEGSGQMAPRHRVGPRFIRRTVRATVLARAKAAGASPAASEVRRWERIIWKWLRQHDLYRNPIGADDPADLVQRAFVRLCECHLLRPTPGALPAEYIRKTIHSIVASAARRADRGKNPAMDRCPLIRTRQAMVSKRDCLPRGPEILPELPDQHKDQGHSDLRLDCSEVIARLPRQERQVLTAVYESAWDYAHAARQLAQLRPEKRWDEHEVRKYCEAAFQSARRDLRPRDLFPGREHGRGAAMIHTLVETLLSRPGDQLYGLDALHTEPQMEQLLATIWELASSDQQCICSKLLDSYLQRRVSLTQVRRATTVYLLSRLRAGDDTYAKELGKRPPRRFEAFLYRCFNVAIGFLGDVQTANAYSFQLWSRRGKEWDRQREFNQAFHAYYYGGAESALMRLRHEIRALRPVNLLALDIATLGMMSTNPADADLLEEQRSSLCGFGVDSGLVEQARQTIVRTTRSRSR